MVPLSRSEDLGQQSQKIARNGRRKRANSVIALLAIIFVAVGCYFFLKPHSMRIPIGHPIATVQTGYENVIKAVESLTLKECTLILRPGFYEDKSLSMRIDVAQTQKMTFRGFRIEFEPVAISAGTITCEPALIVNNVPIKHIEFNQHGADADVQVGKWLTNMVLSALALRDKHTNGVSPSPRLISSMSLTELKWSIRELRGFC